MTANDWAIAGKRLSTEGLVEEAMSLGFVSVERNNTDSARMYYIKDGLTMAIWTTPNKGPHCLP